VKVTASHRTERFYLIKKGSERGDLKGRVAEISVEWLEYLSELIEGLPANSTVIFEPLSELVFMVGFEKTYKFIKKTIDYCAEEQVHLIAFINREAHDQGLKASFEGLFTNIGKIFQDGLRIIK
jgi:hypothetical protein